jgi:hypothetical protein
MENMVKGVAPRMRQIEPQLKSEAGILELVSPLYEDIRGNPNELVQVTPSYGGWLNALRFCVRRADGATTWVTRTDIDSANRRRLIQALKSFTHEPKVGCISGDVSRVRR